MIIRPEEGPAKWLLFVGSSFLQKVPLSPKSWRSPHNGINMPGPITVQLQLCNAMVIRVR